MSGPYWRRWRRVHGPDPEAEVQDEFAFHLEERTAELMAAGLSEAAAREQALRHFGDLSGAAAICLEIGSRRVRRVRWRERLESVAQDLVYAFKAMRRSPGYTLAAVATIALGIGANTAVFSLLNALLLQPLDATNPGELVRIYTSEGHELRHDRDRFGGSSYADYVDLRQSGTLAGLTAVTPLAAYVRLNDATSHFEARIVSENYFTVIDRPLWRGSWRPAESPSEREVIVSHRFWRTTLGADPSVLGRVLVVNGQNFRVAGVTSANFKGIELSNVDLYFPFGSAAALTGRPGLLTDRGERSVRLLGRLARGHSPASAERALDGIMKALAAEYPESNALRTISVRTASSIVPLELTGRGVFATAGLVFGATLVMLAVCGVNIAAVLLARTIRRRREFAVRLSLGASPFRLVRQLVSESVVLAFVAGMVVIALVSLLPVFASRFGVPRSIHPTIDSTVLAYAVAVAITFGVLFGLAPALVGMRSDVVESLRRGEAGARPGKARAQRLLVTSQLALSMLLLLVSGGLRASLDQLQRVDPGFTVERLVVANFEDPSGISDRARNRAFTQLVVQRLSTIPGVTAVSLASMAPFTSDGMRSTIHIPGYSALSDNDMDVAMVRAGPHMFKTLGIPLRRGRELTWNDRDTLSRVVVNQLMARKYWGTRDPVGTFVQLGGPGGTPAEVIGVAADARFISLAEAPHPMYVVQRGLEGGETVLIRTRGDASALLLAVRGSMARNDVPLTLVRLRTMEEILRSSLLVARAVSGTLTAIGILAILLAAVGLYGVVSYVTAGRTREFGIRVALGASPSSITRLVFGYGIRLTVIGGAIGIVLGLAALRRIGDLLFGSWNSAPIAAIVTLVLVAVTLAACAIPALRATALAPATALRSE
ncbi:MAG: ADOP family duplicated permease [Longimicrobiales bacterium]